MSRLTRGLVSGFPIRGCHPLRRAFPDASGILNTSHWPSPRSLATTNGVSLMSFPPATEMFQFTGFASRPYGFRSGYPCGWVAPFGDPGINDCSHLPRAYRSVLRPSSPLSAKASTRCPSHSRLSTTPNGKYQNRLESRAAAGDSPVWDGAKEVLE